MVYMLLSLYVNVAYVLVIGYDVAASKCRHCCGINVVITVCSAAATICCCPHVQILHMCQSLYVMLLLVNVSTAVM